MPVLSSTSRCLQIGNPSPILSHCCSVGSGAPHSPTKLTNRASPAPPGYEEGRKEKVRGVHISEEDIIWVQMDVCQMAVRDGEMLYGCALLLSTCIHHACVYQDGRTCTHMYSTHRDGETGGPQVMPTMSHSTSPGDRVVRFVRFVRWPIWCGAR